MEQKNLINIHCGNAIFHLRKKLKYNQEELASAIGLTRTSVVNIEKGRQGMTVETLLKVCAVLKCKVSDILPNVPSVKLKPIKKVKKVIESKLLDADFKW
jgi:DNA-binding XRE family transcriptional regulator